MMEVNRYDLSQTGKLYNTILMCHTHFSNMKTVTKAEKCITYALLLSAPQIANASRSAQIAPHFLGMKGACMRQHIESSALLVYYSSTT